MLKFTIIGQPIGYKRTTQRGKFCDEDYHRYQAYKSHVVNCFLEQCTGDWGHPKPLTTVKGQKTRVDIMIYFKDFTHGDSDNITKAILDSLFAIDKFCSGSFDFDYDAVNPRVEVVIN